MFTRPLFLAKERVKQVAGTLCSAAFTDMHCICCGAPCRGMPLCPSCVSHYLRTFAPPGRGRCSVCGRPLLGERGTCTSCRSAPVLRSTDSVFPLHTYRLWKKELLHAWKMGRDRRLSPLFADMIADALALLPAGKLPVVPVPPRPGKLFREGWDQIEDLCTFLSFRYGYRVLRLLRRRSTEQQKRKNRAERLDGCGIPPYGPSPLLLRLSAGGKVPEELVLLDDVITTGATAECCASVLRRCGVRKVHVVSLFIVD